MTYVPVQVGLAAYAASIALSEEVLLKGSIWLYTRSTWFWDAALAIGHGLVGVSPDPAPPPNAQNLVTVGRWMSEEEYELMQATGRVVESRLEGVTNLVYPANPGGFAAASKGSVYVEWEVERAVLTVSPTGWAKIYGPSSKPTPFSPGSTYVLNRGRWVVASYSIPGAGWGPVNTYHFSYADARISLLGRGWLGFGSVTIRCCRKRSNSRSLRFSPIPRLHHLTRQSVLFAASIRFFSPAQ
jgi:hypothetical protein